jgi:hypothetical protein
VGAGDRQHNGTVCRSCRRVKVRIGNMLVDQGFAAEPPGYM